MPKILVNSTIKFRTTYDFHRLERNIADINDRFVEKYANGTAEDSENNIWDRKVKPSLEKSTKRIRVQRNQGRDIPLLASFKLIDSIKVIKGKQKKLQMMRYGLLQHKGFTTDSNSMIPNKEVPARPWITLKESNFKRIFKSWQKSGGKFLKKKGR